MARLTRIVRCSRCEQPVSQEEINLARHRETQPIHETCLREYRQELMDRIQSRRAAMGILPDSVWTEEKRVMRSDAAHGWDDEGGGGEITRTSSRTERTVAFKVAGPPGESMQPGQIIEMPGIGKCQVRIICASHSSDRHASYEITCRVLPEVE